MWSILPSPDQAKALLDFWRQTGEDGELRYDLTDPEWDTRFLGDLYQDLSESARKTYALLQTPEFVEEFILNYTLDPAIEEFGLEPEPPYGHAELPHRLRVIDPACGSGHFLLGAFRRLLTAWQTQSQTTDNWVLIANALSSVHGVDKNPFAVAIARFRLMLAAMRAGNVTRLSANVNFPINIAVGDSLLHGYGFVRQPERVRLTTAKSPPHLPTPKTWTTTSSPSTFSPLAATTQSSPTRPTSRSRTRQKATNTAPRYASCYREYSLSVPFAERIFKLAVRGSIEGSGAGYTGQITSNSFMKREFGKKLIEEFFPQVDLTHIIDTSGAYLPGHGTPTVILFGRWRYPRPNSTIRAVLGIQGETGQPVDPAYADVWQAIVNQVNSPGTESLWVSVFDISRDQFVKHPWSLTGGGAVDLLMLIHDLQAAQLTDRSCRNRLHRDFRGR